MWKDAVERDQTHGPAGSTDTGVGARRKRGGAERALRGVAEDPLQMAGALSGARHRGVGGEEPGAASQSTRHPRRSKRSHRPSAATLEGGPRKLLAKLEQTQPEGDWPAASTVADLLRREGLSQAPKKRPRTPPQRRPFTQITQPNQTWCADFKGWFLTGDRARCDPLTLTDAHRRYRLRCQIVPHRYRACEGDLRGGLPRVGYQK